MRRNEGKVMREEKTVILDGNEAAASDLGGAGIQ
jgi:hypothetical protein